MKDWLFYPFILLIIAGGVYYAISFGEGKKPIDPALGLYVVGSDLALLTASPGTNYEVKADGATSYASLSAHTAHDLAPPSAGVFALLTQEYLEYMGGQKIEISITARSGRKKPNDRFEIAFLLSGSGAVPWAEYELGDAYRVYTIETVLGSDAAEKSGVAYIGMWPDTDGRGRTVDVKEIVVKLAEARAVPN